MALLTDPAGAFTDLEGWCALLTVVLLLARVILLERRVKRLEEATRSPRQKL